MERRSSTLCFYVKHPTDCARDRLDGLGIADGSQSGLIRSRLPANGHYRLFENILPALSALMR
jgi:hypothetical protein